MESAIFVRERGHSMVKLEKAAGKAGKAHIRYKNKRGHIVPGVTTILSIIAKPALIRWSNQLGLNGIDSTAYVDETAKIGTLAHEMIQAHLGGNPVDFGAYSRDQINAAENALLSYYEWERRQNSGAIQTIAIELPLVSEMYQFGGTIDWYGKIGNGHWLIDIKTAKGLYPEHTMQVAAYYQLLEENGYKVDGVRLLRVGRSEDEGFDDHVISDVKLGLAWDTFDCARELYIAKQKFEKEEKNNV